MQTTSEHLLLDTFKDVEASIKSWKLACAVDGRGQASKQGVRFIAFKGHIVAADCRIARRGIKWHTRCTLTIDNKRATIQDVAAL
jgi:thiamine biosynthesis protein ThiC